MPVRRKPILHNTSPSVFNKLMHFNPYRRRTSKEDPDAPLHDIESALKDLLLAIPDFDYLKEKQSMATHLMQFRWTDRRYKDFMLRIKEDRADKNKVIDWPRNSFS